MVQGETRLNFRELEEVCLYGNGFSPQHKLIKWFWQIVLHEYSQEEQRRLLVFATGSERAPVNGLR